MKLEHVYITSSWYWIIVIVGTISLRILLSVMRAWEARYKDRTKETADKLKFYDQSFKKRFWIILGGFSKKDPHPDLWYNALIGTIELIVFPILMRADQFTIIGAWIGFKTIAQWSAWNSDRLIFNRFLIANAFLLIICFKILLPWTDIKNYWVNFN